MDMYELVRGPLAWTTFLIFFLGSLYRIFSLFIVGNEEYDNEGSANGIRSILHGLIPFGSLWMRKRPVLTVVFIAFHVGLILVPIFLLAHIILWYESWGIQWTSLPKEVDDALTILVILACIFFGVRRLVVSEAKKVTTLGDFWLLGIIFFTFLTGFLASHQLGAYRPILILHILSGEMLLITIPFSSLFHMIFFGISRAAMGKEYGRFLGARDW